MGVAALSANTPIDTGETALHWQYRIIQDSRRVRIEWYNTNIDANGTSIAILIQYGHATRDGGFIQGRDFINPTMRPIFDQITNEIWKKVNA